MSDNEKKEKDEVQTSVYPDRETYRKAKAKMALEDESLNSLVNQWYQWSKEYVEGKRDNKRINK
jgi:hypothetical protein